MAIQSIGDLIRNSRKTLSYARYPRRAVSNKAVGLPPVKPEMSYLVLVQPVLVATDIGMAIAEWDLNANVIIAHSAKEAARALKNVDCLCVAFLGLPPASADAVQLAADIRARGGRLIFIGDEAEDMGPGPDWSVLLMPFTTNCVWNALRGVPKSRYA